VQVDGRPIDFRSDVLIDLGTGYRVTVRLDGTEPSLGAAIYNRDASSANHMGLAQGQFIGWAALEVPGPQATLQVQSVRGRDAWTVQDRYGVAEDGRDAGRRAQLRRVRTEARILPRPGQPVVRAATARDGRGNVAQAETGVERPAAPSRGGNIQPVMRREALSPDVLDAATEHDRPVRLIANDDCAAAEISDLFSTEPSEELGPIEI
jgi:hypothetical protein